MCAVKKHTTTGTLCTVLSRAARTSREVFATNIFSVAHGQCGPRYRTSFIWRLLAEQGMEVQTALTYQNDKSKTHQLR